MPSSNAEKQAARRAAKAQAKVPPQPRPTPSGQGRSDFMSAGALMQVLCASDDTAMLIRGCVDCRRPTGSFCDGRRGKPPCTAARRLPAEAWAPNQATPFCTVCEQTKSVCKFCRQEEQDEEEELQRDRGQTTLPTPPYDNYTRSSSATPTATPSASASSGQATGPMPAPESAEDVLRRMSFRQTAGGVFYNPMIAELMGATESEIDSLAAKSDDSQDSL